MYIILVKIVFAHSFLVKRSSKKCKRYWIINIFWATKFHYGPLLKLLKYWKQSLVSDKYITISERFREWIVFRLYHSNKINKSHYWNERLPNHKIVHHNNFHNTVNVQTTQSNYRSTREERWEFFYDPALNYFIVNIHM